MGVASDLSIKKIFFTVAMHWSFFIFGLVAVAGWSLGALVKAITTRPSWLFDI